MVTNIKIENFYKCTEIKHFISTRTLCFEREMCYTNSYLNLYFNKHFPDREVMVYFNKPLIGLFLGNKNTDWPDKIINKSTIQLLDYSNFLKYGFSVGDYVYMLDINNNWSKSWEDFNSISKEEWWEFLSTLRNPDIGLINFIFDKINGNKRW